MHAKSFNRQTRLSVWHHRHRLNPCSLFQLSYVSFGHWCRCPTCQEADLTNGLNWSQINSAHSGWVRSSFIMQHLKTEIKYQLVNPVSAAWSAPQTSEWFELGPTNLHRPICQFDSYNNSSYCVFQESGTEGASRESGVDTGACSLPPFILRLAPGVWLSYVFKGDSFTTLQTKPPQNVLFSSHLFPENPVFLCAWQHVCQFVHMMGLLGAFNLQANVCLRQLRDPCRSLFLYQF